MSRRMWQPMKEEVKGICRDYKDVLLDMVRDAGERPVSAALKAYAVGAVVWASNHAPDMLEYQTQLAEASNDLGEVSDVIRKRSAFEHVARRTELMTLNQLDFYWLGPVSLILEREHERQLKIFKATHIPWARRIATLPERFVDVGFNHRWLWLEKVMVDYDIAEDDRAYQ